MTFGESHGPALGVVIDGLPAGLRVSMRDLQLDLDRRAPGRSMFSSPRKEPDEVEVLSGLTAENRTNGAPLALLIRNRDARSEDYETPRKFRPGHGDWPYFIKYGLTPQPGGGRSSGRETVGRVAAGAVARLLLSPLGLKAQSYTVAVGQVRAETIDPDFAERDPLRFADRTLASQAHREVETAMSEGDSVGSVVEVRVSGIPAGWGEPVFSKLDAVLGAAFFSIGGVKAVEFGEGLSLAGRRGSQANDPLGPEGPLTNLAGGIISGLSTGLPVVARLFIKPTPTISREQQSLTVEGQPASIVVNGRHDPCLAPRLGPVAEAMALICLADFHLEPNRHQG